MDNSESNARHGVQPTYKNVTGFQPLQMTWGRFLIDAVFRGGKKHSNHGDSVEKMVGHVVALIRKHYSTDVPIIIRLDSDFFDQKLLKPLRRSTLVTCARASSTKISARWSGELILLLGEVS